jgi:hypothetical protein
MAVDSDMGKLFKLLMLDAVYGRLKAATASSEQGVHK